MISLEISRDFLGKSLLAYVMLSSGGIMGFEAFGFPSAYVVLCVCALRNVRIPYILVISW